MRRRLLMGFAVAVAALACQRGEASLPGNVKEVTVEELAAETSAKTAIPVDANNEGFRKANGVIPGAVLLTNYRKYPMSELGPDTSKRYVFYCSSRT